MRLAVSAEIARAARTDNPEPLYALLDCDRYTREGDQRALEGRGFAPCALTDDERAAILAALEELEQ